MEKTKALEIYQKISELFPDACCELNYHNYFELLVSVMLSAQTTDKNVNKVTPSLFEKYPDALSLSQADLDDVIKIIKTIGLANSKGKNIINMSKKLIEEKDGQVPCDFNYLTTLPGVGRKTANVILAEGFKMPAIAVDTHVLRISNRLGLSNATNPDLVENDLKQLFDKELWADVHIKLLFFGRYLCKAKNPNCVICPFKNQCKI